MREERLYRDWRNTHTSIYIYILISLLSRDGLNECFGAVLVCALFMTQESNKEHMHSSICALYCRLCGIESETVRCM